MVYDEMIDFYQVCKGRTPLDPDDPTKSDSKLRDDSKPRDHAIKRGSTVGQ